MNKNAFQTELDRVSFTPAGRAALTEALMRGETLPARRPVSWARRGMAAALAAAVLIGSAVAAGTLWERYFGRLDETQQEVIETLSRDLPAAESNGTVMTPLAAFGDQDFYYLMLEIRAPEGTVLPDYGEDEGFYQLFGDTLEEGITLTDVHGQDVLCTLDYDWFNDDPTDNILTAAIRLWSMEDADLCDGTDKVLHIPGLWVQSPGKVYTPVLTGGWDFNIGTHSGGIESRTPDVAGVTVEDEECGTMTMEYLRLSPLGMRIRHSWSEPREGVCPGAPLSVVMEDGSEVFLKDTVGSCGENWNEEYGPFEAPINLNRAVAVRWGTALLSLKGNVTKGTFMQFGGPDGRLGRSGRGESQTQKGGAVKTAPP